MLPAHKPIPPTEAELEAMADALAASGQYRIQRRLRPRPKLDEPAGTELKQALFVDVETTGLDHQSDEFIELAMVPFTYGPEGQVYEVREPFQRFNQPSKPISAEITKLTGISDEMVAGHSIDPAEVEAFAKDAVLTIAHNAGFDRRFMEKLAPAFALKGWACSQSQIDWSGEGIEGTRLSYLVAGAGYFYDKHRAVNDCLHAQTDLFENGLVLLPKDASWLQDYILEITGFPGTRHDDQVDSTAQALDHMRVPSSLEIWALLGSQL